MSQQEFWELIERSRADNDKDPEAQAGALEELLVGRSSEELQAFDRTYREQLARAYTWDLWGAGYLLEGGMGDDSFDYFRDWLIGRGRSVFERVLADPDELAEVASFEEEMEAESLRYAVQQAHERTHGAELPWDETTPSSSPGEPAGEEWDEDDEGELQRRLPRIAARIASE